MHRSLYPRLLVWTLIAVWTAPGMGALALSLHLALDHGHGHHPAATAEALAFAAVHGHHHAVTVPDHEHRATTVDRHGPRMSPKPAASPPPSLALGLPPSDGDGTDLSRQPRGQPPDPLFYKNCALLL